MAALPPISQVVGPHSFGYEALFKQADTRGKGSVTAVQAATFLKQSGLKESVLSQIWDLSDPGGKGYLDKHAFYIALKLIALVQNGKEANMANIALPVSMPNMGPANAAMEASSNNNTGWIITVDEKAKYDKVFEGLKPVDGRLPGDRVRPVLLNSKLPVDVLGRIWDLSDIDGDGFLDSDEFAVAMHLVVSAREKKPMPATLPVNLVPPSKRKSDSASVKASTPPAVSSPPAGVGNSGGVKWVVSAADKVRYDEMFEKADSDKDGYVNGTEIKGIFLKSGLQQQVLARIWALCDTRNMGKLTKDQFALALYLIQQKLKGVDPPARLPPEMVPPTTRRSSLVDGVIPAGLVVNYSSPGMKELDGLGVEIDSFRSDRVRLEQEKSQKDADIRTRNSEITTLQKELEVLAAAAKKLELQKVDAQKRLDDLDKKKSKLENSLEESETKCADALKQVEQLHTELSAKEDSDLNLDSDVRAKREELHQLRQEELNLELKIESGHNRLVQLMKFLRGTQTNMNQAEYIVSRLQDTVQNLQRTIEQFDLLFNAEMTEEQGVRHGLFNGLFIDHQPMSVDWDAFTSDEYILATPGFSRNADGELTYELPIDSLAAVNDDVLSEMNHRDKDVATPPGDSSPFAVDTVDTYATKKPEPIAAPAKPQPARPPPLGEDPWSYSRLLTKAQNDPFAASGISSMKSPINSDDPFGTGSFAPADDSKNLQPGSRPARPKSPGPGRPKSPAPPGGRPKSPVPPGRPKSPVPPGRPKSPSPAGSKPKSSGPPPRPSAPPSKSPSSFHGDSDAAASGSLRNGSSNIMSPGAADLSYSDFSSSQFSSNEAAWH